MPAKTTEPVWPTYPGIPDAFYQPLQRPQRTVAYPPKSDRQILRDGSTLAPGQLYDEIASLAPDRLTGNNIRGDQNASTFKHEYKAGIGYKGRRSLLQPTRVPSRFTPKSGGAYHQLPEFTDKKRAHGPLARFVRRPWVSNLVIVVKCWFMEILSWLLSAACMGTTIIILLVFDGRRLSDWKFALSPNAYISVLSKIATSALIFPVAESLGQLKWSWFRNGSQKLSDFEVFDNASRGPWGSALLLKRTKSSLATVGAIITIVTIALDPFFQSVFTFTFEEVLLSRNSTIPRIVYMGPDAHKSRDGTTLIYSDSTLDDMAETFWWANGTQPIPAGFGFRPDVPLHCATEHCQWEAYQSLGVCGTCKDMTVPMDWACHYGTLDWSASSQLQFWIDYSSKKFKANRNGTSCGWWINSTSTAPVLMSGFAQNPNNSVLPEEILLTRTLPLIDPNTRTASYNGRQPAFPDVVHPLASFFFVTSADGTAASVMASKPPLAQECVMYWCVQTLKSSYDEGRYTEEVLSEYHEPDNTSWPWMHDLPLPDEGWFGIPFINITLPGSGTTYSVSNVTHIEAITIPEGITPLYVTTTNFSDNAQFRYYTWDPQGSTVVDIVPSQNSLVGKNITNLIERLALAFTNIYRTKADTEYVWGDTFGEATLIRVQWRWLALPGVVLLGSLLFFLATMCKSFREREQVGIWKTSAIATLLHGFPATTRESLLNDPEKSINTIPEAHKWKVELQSSRDGWRFSKMEPSTGDDKARLGWLKDMV